MFTRISKYILASIAGAILFGFALHVFIDLACMGWIGWSRTQTHFVNYLNQHQNHNRRGK